MDSYIKYTEAYLAMVQGTLTETEMERSSKAGEEMFEAIKEIVEKYELNIREMLNATVAVHYNIMGSANEQLEDYKVERAKQYE